MDSRLLQALTANRIAIVRKVTGTRTAPSDDPKLLERCRDLTFHDTETQIKEIDRFTAATPVKATGWLHGLTRFFRSDR
jgi:hypothetical protein